MRHHLHTLGYAVIRLVLSMSSPDERYAEKGEKLRAHQAVAKRGEVVLLFDDEMDLHVLPSIAGCWTKRGSQRKVPMPGKNQKCYSFGAVNAVTGAVTRLIRERKNSESFCALVEAIVAAYCPGECWEVSMAPLSSVPSSPAYCRGLLSWRVLGRDEGGASCGQFHHPSQQGDAQTAGAIRRLLRGVRAADLCTAAQRDGVALEASAAQGDA